MKVLINSMTQEEVNQYLERVVECAFHEGKLWAQCGGEKLSSLSDAIKAAKSAIIYDGCL